jgi:hypothetical protein
VGGGPRGAMGLGHGRHERTGERRRSGWSVRFATLALSQPRQEPRPRILCFTRRPDDALVMLADALAQHLGSLA